MKVYIWLISGMSIITVCLALYLLCLFRNVHDGKVSGAVRMSDAGHGIAVGIVYILPVMLGITQVVAWVGYWDDWGDGGLLALLFSPILILVLFYCLLKGSSHNDAAVGLMAQSLESRDLVFRQGDHLKYITVGGTKKPAETGHHCDLVAGPPIAGLTVLQTLPGGYLRLLFPRQLYAQAIPGGGSAIVGPFESITHISYLARDPVHEELPRPVEIPRPYGVHGADIFARHPLEPLEYPPPIDEKVLPTPL